MYRTLLFSTLFHSLSILLTISASADQFPDDLIVSVDRDGRHLTLVNDFRFVDNQVRTWTAPAGTIVDGASIPQPLWSLVGGPLEGKYREASVIHDHYCVTRNRPWDQVHKVFYDAMIANGVSLSRANLMYLAVYRFGPRWDLDYTFYCKPGWSCESAQEHKYHIDEFMPPFNDKEFQEIADNVISFDLSNEKELQSQIEEYKYRLDISFRKDIENHLKNKERIIIRPLKEIFR